MLHNQQTQGGTWQLHGITRAQVLARMQPVKAGMPQLWSFVEEAIDACVKAGYLSVAAEPELKK